MSDAVHVTIDDMLFIIGPNTAHISSLSVINPILSYMLLRV